MKLRIVSGELKGRYITIGDDVGFRPTQGKVREAVADIVKRKILGANVADICAGSGAFGFEMLSRGAAHVDFIENNQKNAAKIADNARTLNIGGKIKILRDDVRKFANAKNNLNGAGKYDLIYYDPPYDFDELVDIVPALTLLLNGGGILMYERRRLRHEKKITDVLKKENMQDARMYSDTVVEFYTKEKQNADCNISGDV